HASLLDGCMLSRAEFKRYSHRDMDSLENLLKKNRGAGNVWIVTDSLFSMDGDLAPLPEICSLAEKYKASVYLDDAHAFGIFGKKGRVGAEHFGVADRIDVRMGTLGKAAGGLGAFAAGSKAVIDYLKNRARSFIYSTAMPAACALGAAKAIDIFSDFGDERIRFWNVTENFIAELKGMGFETDFQSYIIPLITGETEEALTTARWFWEQGVYMQAIRPPTVPEGSARLRLTLSLAQNEQDRRKLLGLINQRREKFKLVKEPGY
ncbi:MAG: aminotransferase class I/II-fold pyridoxal phosphate-dependent enzyme, partial [Nitrospinota bacterium]